MKSPNVGEDLFPGASIAVLEQRSQLLRKLRQFFYDREFIEVETPLLGAEVIPELHIEPIRVGDAAFLQASPELHMKRLLAAGARAIFQVTRSFRGGERGPLHNPEFTIVEWYRIGDDMQAGMNFLDELMQTLVKSGPALRTTYADAFQRVFGFCSHTATIDHLCAAATEAGVNVPIAIDRADRDEWLNLLLAARIESQLGGDRPEIIYHYPATQASLAKVMPTQLGYPVAERFELYYHGIELANGFHELTDAGELRCRLDAVNAARAADGRAPLPLPRSLLSAMETGLPDCTGCALGFDRLAMLAIGIDSIDGAIAFPTGSA